jgi:hypothetical protein
MVWMPGLNSEAMNTILSSILSGWLGHYKPKLKELGVRICILLTRFMIIYDHIFYDNMSIISVGRHMLNRIVSALSCKNGPVCRCPIHLPQKKPSTAGEPNKTKYYHSCLNDNIHPSIIIFIPQ